jgi:hypothetical protein
LPRALSPSDSFTVVRIAAANFRASADYDAQLPASRAAENTTAATLIQDSNSIW